MEYAKKHLEGQKKQAEIERRGEEEQRKKQKDNEPQNLEKPIKGRAIYWGGHSLHPPSELGDNGNFILTNEKIIFQKIAILGNKWIIEIPINKILLGEVKQETGEDFGYKQRTSALSFFATGLPVSSFSRITTFITIPYIDENNVKQTPKFTFDNNKTLEEVSKFLYEKISKLPKKKEESPLDILKIRYAKGEITKKEFEQMKKDLE